MSQWICEIKYYYRSIKSDQSRALFSNHLTKNEILIVPEMFCDQLHFISILNQKKVSTRVYNIIASLGQLFLIWKSVN